MTDRFHSPDRLFPPLPDSCELSVVCSRSQYSASAIARAVEDADAHLLNLNVTSVHPWPRSSDDFDSDALVVDLRVSHRNAGAVARSLERYGFTVGDIRQGFDADFENLRSRIEQLMTQIEL